MAQINTYGVHNGSTRLTRVSEELNCLSFCPIIWQETVPQAVHGAKQTQSTPAVIKASTSRPQKKRRTTREEQGEIKVDFDIEQGDTIARNLLRFDLDDGGATTHGGASKPSEGALSAAREYHRKYLSYLIVSKERLPTYTATARRPFAIFDSQPIPQPFAPLLSERKGVQNFATLYMDMLSNLQGELQAGQVPNMRRKSFWGRICMLDERMLQATQHALGHAVFDLSNLSMIPRHTLETLKKPGLYLRVAILPDGTVHTYVGSSFEAAGVQQRLTNAYDRPLAYAKAGRWHAGLASRGFAQYTANMVAKENASFLLQPLMIFDAVNDKNYHQAEFLLSPEMHFHESLFITFFKSATNGKKMCFIPVLELIFEICRTHSLSDTVSQQGR
ncbi:hypothetical protein B0A48_07518 [Cryoendolithus antarcticus]|uniref:Uncharacterized protein n=1 Tax=Cryoendolithus antarcticus TaxID=1507870 RepID=A0A1V8T6Y8_9PEZI|nr:hypothetical protein B0A48_07518 [Cryoendolithus antarcticus]